MGRITTATLQFGGYKLRLRIRVVKRKRTVKGRTRGKYEGEYVYMEVTAPNGEKKDKYIGPAHDLAAMLNGRRVKPPSDRNAGTDVGTAAKGKKDGQKAYCTVHETEDRCYLTPDEKTGDLFRGETGPQNEWPRGSYGVLRKR